MNKPENILNEWMDGINAADVEKLINLYDEKAVLFPTFSNRILDTKEKIKEYFEKVGAKEKLSIKLHDKTVTTQELEDQIFCLSGIYTWCFSIDGEPYSFEARFTYVFDLSKDNPIVHHHSSQIPRML